jgi:hypothetical protein
MTINITRSVIKALAQLVKELIRAIDEYRYGSCLLILMILSVGVSTGLSHAQITIT